MGQESAIGLWEQFSGLDEIWAVGRRKDRLEKLEEKVNIPVRKFALDLSQEKDRELLKEKLVRLKPQVKFLVNAAGFGKIGNVCDLPEKDQTGICLLYTSLLMMQTTFVRVRSSIRMICCAAFRTSWIIPWKLQRDVLIPL